MSEQISATLKLLDYGTAHDRGMPAADWALLVMALLETCGALGLTDFASDEVNLLSCIVKAAYYKGYEHAKGEKALELVEVR